MRRFWVFVVGLMAPLLLLFTVVEALDVDLLVDPSPWLASASVAAAAIGVGLLVVDVVLPVPSSLVMIALGSLFGLGAGAALAFVGTVGAGLVGFAVGRGGEDILNRFIGPEEQARADRLIERWGLLAIALTRWIPILAETTAIVAGTSRIRWPAAFAAVAIGSLPVAIVFAYLGAAGASAIR